MREIRTSGSEGGGTEPNRFSLPLSAKCRKCVLKDAGFPSRCRDLEATSYQDVHLALRSRARLSRRDLNNHAYRPR